MTGKQKAFYWILLISGTFGVVLSFFIQLQNSIVDINLISFLITFLTFPIMANIAVIIFSLSQIYASQHNFSLRLSTMTSETALASYLLMCLLGFFISNSIQSTDTVIINIITPVIYLAFWLVCCRGKPIKLKQTAVALLPAGILIGFWIAISLATNQNIYPSLSIFHNGISGVLFMSACLLLGTWLINVILLIISKYTTPLYV